MNDIDDYLDFADAVGEWFLDLSQGYLELGDVESGLRSAHVAATVLARQNRRLTSARMEALLKNAAHLLGEIDHSRYEHGRNTRKLPVCLHVMDEALPAGGLTAMATRWIQGDHEKRVQNVALLSQTLAVPLQLQRAVADARGEVFFGPSSSSFVEKARWLRSLAVATADIVVLHVGVSDTVWAAAFGCVGGPPVILVNHAAHIFWTGASIPDVVANCRGSALEQRWTTEYRGAASAVVPIPLPETLATDRDEDQAQCSRSVAMQKLRLAPDALVIATVGAPFKYRPMEGLDFLEVAEGILRQAPHVFLLAVGIPPDERWSAASDRVGSRIRMLGPLNQSDLAEVHACCDVYIEGFPFGSTTALLEAGFRRIPVVLAPLPCPPPYGSDGIALDALLQRPASPAEYESEVLRLLNDANLRSEVGRRVQGAIRQHHSGSGWKDHLERTIAALPAIHRTRVPVATPRTPRLVYQHWAHFVNRVESPFAETLEHAITRALLLGLRPRITIKACDACRSAYQVREGHGVPVSVLVALLNVVLPWLPRSVGTSVFRTVAAIFRGDAIRQGWLKLRARFAVAPTWRRGYEVYRDIGDNR